jgi:RimJ/RimL family protein N-acetyltransferase
VLDHALNTLRLRQVIADIDPKNVASIAVARKLGFTDAGTTMYAGREVIRSWGVVLGTLLPAQQEPPALCDEGYS